MTNTTKILACLAFAAASTIVPGASAQQQNNAQANGSAHPVAHNPFPVSAARYELMVSKQLEMLRKARPMGPMTQSDLNKAILLFRDCASRVEADGLVTYGEVRQCQAVVIALKHERVREVMATSTPEDWARWGAQAPHH